MDEKLRLMRRDMKIPGIMQETEKINKSQN